jgi:hypothetical protein
MSLFPIIITKKILGRNVALNSFVVGLPQQLQEGKMGAAECTALALEEECDDLVGIVGGG